MAIRTKVGSIREIHRQLVAEGYNISEYALRQWVKDGRVPAVYSGKKAYIRYDSATNAVTGSSDRSA